MVLKSADEDGDLNSSPSEQIPTITFLNRLKKDRLTIKPVDRPYLVCSDPVLSKIMKKRVQDLAGIPGIKGQRSLISSLEEPWANAIHDDFRALFPNIKSQGREDKRSFVKDFLVTLQKVYDEPEIDDDDNIPDLVDDSGSPAPIDIRGPESSNNNELDSRPDLTGPTGLTGQVGLTGPTGAPDPATSPAPQTSSIPPLPKRERKHHWEFEKGVPKPISDLILHCHQKYKIPPDAKCSISVGLYMRRSRMEIGSPSSSVLTRMVFNFGQRDVYVLDPNVDELKDFMKGKSAAASAGSSSAASSA